VSAPGTARLISPVCSRSCSDGVLVYAQGGELASTQWALRSVVRSSVPKRIRQSGKPIDHPSLNDEEEHCHFDDYEVARSGEDSQGNDQRSGARGRVAHLQQNHQRARCPQRKSCGQDFWSEGARLHSERQSIRKCLVPRARMVTASALSAAKPKSSILITRSESNRILAGLMSR